MKKILLFLTVLITVLFGAVRSNYTLKTGLSLDDNFNIIGSTTYVTDADSLFSAKHGLGDIEQGWMSLSFRAAEVSGTGQTFNLYYRLIDDNGASEWYEIGTGVAVNEKFDVYVSADTNWRPAGFIQFLAVSAGTGRSQPKMIISYN
jgi:hypothetical protein